jgi:hypothetical protein
MNAKRALVALVLFAGMTVLHTWPLASAPATLSRNDNADTVLNEWAIAWVAHQLPRNPLKLFDANIFYPERKTLAFSEHMIVQAVMGLPLFAAGATPVLAYNLLVLAGFALTGWGMYLVVARWTDDHVAGLVAGLLAAFNAHSFTRLPHLQALHVEFLPLAIYALDRLLVTRRHRWAVALAAAFSLQSLTSNYWMVFSTFAVAAAFGSRPGEWWNRQMFGRLALAASIVACAVLPFLWPYYSVSRDLGLVRSLQDVGLYSGSWRDYLSTPGRLHFALWSDSIWQGGGKTPLFPGVLAIVLAVTAVVTSLRANGVVRMWTVVALIAVLLSFGTELPGYSALYHAFPLLQGIRAPIRAGHLFLIAVAALAGFGLAQWRRRGGVTRHPAVAVAIAALATVEALVAPVPLQTTSEPPAIYRVLARETRAVIAHLPLAPPRAPQHNAYYMYVSTEHWRPIVNGYSGFLPGSYVHHYERLRTFPSPEALAYLEDIGVTHVVLYGGPFPTEPAFEPVAVEGEIGIFRLRWERIDSGQR